MTAFVLSFIAQWSLSTTITASCMGQTIELRRTGHELSDILFVPVSSPSSPEGLIDRVS